MIKLILEQLDERITPATGDADFNGAVDHADFIEFRNAYQRGPSAVFDFDGNGQVDQADFEAFRAIYGTVTPGFHVNPTTGVATIQGTAFHDDVGISTTPNHQVIMVARNDAGTIQFQQVSTWNPMLITAFHFYGYAGNDRFNANDITIPVWAYGGDGGDQLQGGSGNDHLYGEAGSDTLRGHGGDDYLDGGPDMDWLYGGSGTNTLIAGDSGLNFLYPDQD